APALAYLTLEPQDLSTWQGVIDFLVSVGSNPYLLVLTAVNAINLIPDPTTPNLSDSERVLNKTSVKD
ncbi:holin, partial [Bacillus thuringiensis]|nr:holin [Bacillus thuringiensis]